MILDIVLLVIVLVIVFLSAKKGLVRTVLDIAVLVLTVVLAFQIASPMAEKFYSEFVSERIEMKLTDALTSKDAVTNTQKAAAALQSLPSFVTKALEKNGVQTDSLSERIASGEASKDTAAYLNKSFVAPICKAVLTGVLFFLLSAVLGSLLQWAAKGIAKLFKVPIVRSANTFLGGVLGIIKGAVLVYAVVAVLILCTSVSTEGKLKQEVKSSRVVAFTQSYLPEFINYEV